MNIKNSQHRSVVNQWRLTKSPDSQIKPPGVQTHCVLGHAGPSPPAHARQKRTQPLRQLSVAGLPCGIAIVTLTPASHARHTSLPQLTCERTPRLRADRRCLLLRPRRAPPRPAQKLGRARDRHPRLCESTGLARWACRPDHVGFLQCWLLSSMVALSNEFRQVLPAVWDSLSSISSLLLPVDTACQPAPHSARLPSTCGVPRWTRSQLHSIDLLRATPCAIETRIALFLLVTGYVGPIKRVYPSCGPAAYIHCPY